jgi:hypothetical protein
MECNRMAGAGMEWNGIGRDGMRGNGMAWNGVGCDVMRSDEIGSDVM